MNPCLLLVLCGAPVLTQPAPPVWLKVKERDERLVLGVPVVVRPKTNGFRSILDLEASFGLNWGNFPLVRTSDYQIGFRYRF